jgi:hypothetical protein
MINIDPKIENPKIVISLFLMGRSLFFRIGAAMAISKMHPKKVH